MGDPQREKGGKREKERGGKAGGKSRWKGRIAETRRAMSVTGREQGERKRGREKTEGEKGRKTDNRSSVREV